MHFFVVFTLPMIEFGHILISVPKIVKNSLYQPWTTVIPLTLGNPNQINQKKFFSHMDHLINQLLQPLQHIPPEVHQPAHQIANINGIKTSPCIY